MKFFVPDCHFLFRSLSLSLSLLTVAVPKIHFLTLTSIWLIDIVLDFSVDLIKNQPNKKNTKHFHVNISLYTQIHLIFEYTEITLSGRMLKHLVD